MLENLSKDIKPHSLKNTRIFLSILESEKHSSALQWIKIKNARNKHTNFQIKRVKYVK